MFAKMMTWASIFTLCAAWVTACSKGAMRDSSSPSGAAYDGGGGGGYNDTAAEGAASTWKRSTLSPLSSRLTVGDNEALPLVSTEIRARIDAFRAR